MSAAYSQASGEPASNGGGGAFLRAGGGSMHLSPMSDDGDGAAPLPPPLEPQPDEFDDGYPGQEGGEETWDQPDAAFSAFVADTVRRRVGKYAQPDHPMCISQDEAGQVRRVAVAVCDDWCQCLPQSAACERDWLALLLPAAIPFISLCAHKFAI
jgi:hypothetical protein